MRRKKPLFGCSVANGLAFSASKSESLASRRPAQSKVERVDSTYFRPIATMR
jgi:hypothetical protein